MIFFRAELIAALLIGLGSARAVLRGRNKRGRNTTHRVRSPPAPVLPSQPIPLDPDRASRDPVAPTDT